MRIAGYGLAGALGAIIALAGWAYFSKPVDQKKTEAAASVAPEGSIPYRVTTKHSVEIGGKTIAYKVIAGETFLVNAKGAPIGSVFSFSYFRTNPADASRPVLFVFNGGPGAASVWLHMGVVGPRRLVLDSEINPSNVPPFGVADNPHSVLDVADIVFIDPVGTGFSRIVGEGTPADFWGVDEDANSVAQFIELWLTEYGRWNSPKFIMGESYGSIRAAVLPRALMGSPIYTGVMRGITVNGIVLLGTTLNGRIGQAAPEETALKSALALPSVAATAWRHGRTAKQDMALEDLYAEAIAYAKGDYVAALIAKAEGMLSEADEKALVDNLTAYTGLSAEAIGDDLAVSEREFAKLLLKNEGLEVGMYDSRYTLPLANSGGDPVADDPAMGRYVPGFISAFHQMLYEDLNVKLARPYAAIMWKDLLQGWNWKRGGVAEGQSYAVDLSWAMRRNEDLHVLVASGYYDLVTTPIGAAESLSEVGIPESRITFKNYESGHMLYLGDTAEAFANDVRELIASATPNAGSSRVSPP
jgi:carboxypeptidase C (cathepsin A)